MDNDRSLTATVVAPPAPPVAPPGRPAAEPLTDARPGARPRPDAPDVGADVPDRSSATASSAATTTSERPPAARRTPPERSSSPEHWWRRLHRRHLLIAGGAALALAGAVTAAVLTAEPAPETIALTSALDRIDAGEVRSAVLFDAVSSVDLELADGTTVRSEYPEAFAGDLTATLVEASVDVTTENGRASVAEQVLARVLVMVLVVGLILILVRTARGGGVGSLGGKRKALTSGEIPQVTFADVAGADEAVDQLREMVQLLREPERFEAVGAQRPRGGLLVGPPGTGKTLLARAVAGEAEVPFFALAGSDFVETYVGVGARRVRDLFAQARKVDRAIIFIDEIDAVGRARSSNAQGNGGDGERENTLISLLNEMDGFVGSHIIVLAATNRADTLDPALTRPGRLDRQIQVPNPDRRGRTLILQVHARSKPVGPDVDLVTIARQTPGMSGADLAQVVNEACMEAARRDQSVVDASCFQAAVATVAMGRARTSALVTEHDRLITAWHEAGHTLAAALLPDADDPVSVTIVPRGPAGGVTWMSGNDDIFLPRKKALAQLVVALAGRAAEERLLDGEYTQGASGDLQSATNLATAMVTKYAMTDFGYAQLDDETLRVGGQVAAQAHAKVDELLRDAHREATALLTAHHPLLEAVAAALLVEETLSVGRVRQIIAEFEAVPEGLIA